METIKQDYPDDFTLLLNNTMPYAILVMNREGVIQQVSSHHQLDYQRRKIFAKGRAHPPPTGKDPAKGAPARDGLWRWD